MDSDDSTCSAEIYCQTVLIKEEVYLEDEDSRSSPPLMKKEIFLDDSSSSCELPIKSKIFFFFFFLKKTSRLNRKINV